MGIYYVRHVPSGPDARHIAVQIARGEKITDRKTSRRKIAGRDGGSDYWHYEEATTVSGPGYTRYLLNSFSTSSLPARRRISGSSALRTKRPGNVRRGLPQIQSIA